MKVVTDGNADVAGLIPVHARMLDSGGQYPYYDVAGTISKYWRYVGCQSQKNAGTSAVGSISTDHGWTPENGHSPAVAYAAYLTGGEWYHLTNLYGMAHWFSTGENTVSHNQDWPNPYIALGVNGIIVHNDNGRYHAWPVRTIGMAAFVAPDGTAEKNYLMNLVLHNAAYMEGVFGVRGPLYSTKTTTPYDHYNDRSSWFGGFMSVAGGQANPLGFSNGPAPTAAEPEFLSSVVPGRYNSIAMWGHHFLAITYGLLSEWFPFASGAAEGAAKLPISMVASGRPIAYTSTYYTQSVPANSDFPLLTQAYNSANSLLYVDHIPTWMRFPAIIAVSDASGSEALLASACDRVAKTITIERHRLWWSNAVNAPIGASLSVRYPFQDWAAWDTAKDMTNYGSWWNTMATSAHMTDWPGADGYSNYALAAAAYSYPWAANGWLGKVAWDRARADQLDPAGGGGLPAFNSKPRFALKPRFDPVRVKATPGDTFVILEYTKPRPDEACTVDGVSDSVTNSRWVRFVKTGIAAGSAGAITISCASDPYGATSVAYTTLGTLSGAGSYTWATPGASVRLNYGSTAALGASTPYQDCSTGCSVTIPRGLQYVQLERQNGPAGPITPVKVN
jgi:hypothetical protein